MASAAPPQAAQAPERKLLVIDTTNTFELIKARGTEDSVTCRDLGGYFTHVWSVHPVATLTTSDEWTPRFGPSVEYRLNDRHVFIEGKVGRFHWLRRLFLLNFIVGQAATFVSLYRLIRRERISVIRAGDPLYTGLMSWALARLSGIPFVVRVGANHDKYYEVVGSPVMPRLFRKRKYEKIAERFVFRRADVVAAANGDYREFAVANGARPDRVTVFPYGNLLDRRHFVPPAERPAKPAFLDQIGVRRKGFLLYIGRLEEGKRPGHVLLVLAELRARGHDLKAVLVGEGRLEAELGALAGKLGIADHVVLAGSRSQEWLAAMIPCAAVVLSPVTGRALAEAALGGAPVVAYDIDWQSDIVRSGETGELVPYLDWEAMADAADRLLGDPAYAEQVGRNLREEARDMFDPERLDRHEREQYDALIARHPGGVKR